MHIHNVLQFSYYILQNYFYINIYNKFDEQIVIIFYNNNFKNIFYHESQLLRF